MLPHYAGGTPGRMSKADQEYIQRILISRRITQDKAGKRIPAAQLKQVDMLSDSSDTGKC